MPAHNADIAEQFNRLADLLEIEEANRFRVRAYRRAAQTIQELPESVAKMVAEGRDLDELPGIGEDLAGKIAEIVKTGHCRMLEEVEARTPSTLATLTSIAGLGPKRRRAHHPHPSNPGHLRISENAGLPYAAGTRRTLILRKWNRAAARGCWRAPLSVGRWRRLQASRRQRASSCVRAVLRPGMATALLCRRAPRRRGDREGPERGELFGGQRLFFDQ